MRKWWLIVPLIVLIGTLFLFFKYRNLLQKTQNIKLSLGEPTQVSLDGKEKIDVTQQISKVTSWDFDGGKLKVQDNQGKERVIDIDPASIKVFTPFIEKDKRGAMRVIFEKEGITWETAFCAGDEVNVITDDTGKIVSVMNIGQRICGAI